MVSLLFRFVSFVLRRSLIPQLSVIIIPMLNRPHGMSWFDSKEKSSKCRCPYLFSILYLTHTTSAHSPTTTTNNNKNPPPQGIYRYALRERPANTKASLLFSPEFCSGPTKQVASDEVWGDIHQETQNRVGEEKKFLVVGRAFMRAGTAHFFFFFLKDWDSGRDKK